MNYIIVLISVKRIHAEIEILMFCLCEIYSTYNFARINSRHRAHIYMISRSYIFMYVSIKVSQFYDLNVIKII